MGKGIVQFDLTGKLLRDVVTNVPEYIVGFIERQSDFVLYTSKAKRYYSTKNWKILLEGKPVRGKVMVGGGK